MGRLANWAGQLKEIGDPDDSFNVEDENITELNFGLDLLNLAGRLSADAGGDTEKLRDAVHVLRTVGRGSKASDT